MAARGGFASKRVEREFWRGSIGEKRVLESLLGSEWHVIIYCLILHYLTRDSLEDSLSKTHAPLAP